MGFTINNPVPRSLGSECKKAARTLASFVKPNQLLGADQVIPPSVLQNAKGLAVITVLKAGFLFSGRAGSGVIVSRLPDGSWSAPSAIMTAGAGVGGQIGAELTDFVFILNTKNAVESFAQMGSITLGGNISLAAGPVGRNAEAAGTASLKSAAAVFSYSKTKGLFAGVSLEGSVIVERRISNRKFYGGNCTAKSILSGNVEPPPSCDPLFRVLDSRVFSRRATDYDYNNDDIYNDIPTSFSDDDSSYDEPRGGRRRATFGSGGGRSSRSHYQRGTYSDDDDDYDDDYNDRRGSRRNTYGSASSKNAKRQVSTSSWEDDLYDANAGANHANPGRPKSSKPMFGDDEIGQLSDDSDQIFDAPKKSAKSTGNQAVALYSFEAEQDGDLSFKKGDIITVIEKSDSKDDWWSGRCHGREGIFPANYIELQ